MFGDDLIYIKDRFAIATTCIFFCLSWLVEELASTYKDLLCSFNRSFIYLLYYLFCVSHFEAVHCFVLECLALFVHFWLYSWMSVLFSWILWWGFVRILFYVFPHAFQVVLWMWSKFAKGNCSNKYKSVK